MEGFAQVAIVEIEVQSQVVEEEFLFSGWQLPVAPKVADGVRRAVVVAVGHPG